MTWNKKFCWFILFLLFLISIGTFFFVLQKRVIVAVVDTGVDLKQMKFRLIVDRGYNILEPNKPPQDDNGHGTQISSIISFLEPRIKILPVKVIDKSGVTTKENLARGIIKAIDLGAKIINISSGVISSSTELEQAVAYAEEKGVIIVAAVGDNGTGIDFPAAYPTVIAVGGVDLTGKKLINSNIGSELDLVTLGEYNTIGLGGRCEQGSGTSLSAPIVSVFLAKLLLHQPNLTVEEMRNNILNSVKDIGSLGKDDSHGFGLLDSPESVTILCE